MNANVTVVGQLARDLVLVLDGGLPEAGTSGAVRERREQLGGKGANQAVALAQLGARPALVAVAGDDPAGDVLLEQARADGIDVSAVVRRPGTATGLIVEVLQEPNRWRYLEHLPEPVLLSAGDVTRADRAFGTAEAVLVQLQQPEEAVLAAARRAANADALVVLDGAAPARARDELLALADVVRADAHEAWLLTGADSPQLLEAAAADLVRAGPRVAALAFAEGNVFAWRGPGPNVETLTLPLGDEKLVDTTGAGDALVAALTVALLRGDPVPDAARFAVAASGATVGHPSGRPALLGLG
ncbi:PfkB family carbohydrate kinase [Dactylosporangium sp. NPDC000244]|uniref:PfkB family carbohydrate kinase n=1 Tax=Dactylosporangium sp. NPDC000244 TaxID=3154365 RepID=UPI0033239331